MNSNTADYDYRKYLQLVIKQRHLFAGLALLIMTIWITISYSTPEQYEAKCTVYIEKGIINDLIKGIAVAPSFDDKVKVFSYAITSRTLLTKVCNDLKLNVAVKDAGAQERMIRDFQKRTDVKLKDQQGLFTISFSDKDPRLARDYVNTLVRRYIDESTSSTRAESSGATKILEEQIATVKAKMDENERMVDGFKRNNADALGLSESGLLAETSAAQQKIEEIAIKRQQLEGLLIVAKKNDPLQAKLTALQNRYKELSLVYTESHPEIISIINEMASLRHNPATATPTPEVQNIVMELSSLRTQEASQRRMIAGRTHVLRSIPAAKSTLGELERDLNSQKNLYNQLTARLAQAEIAKQMGVEDKSSTFRIIDPAILPVSSTNQQRLRNILLGILAGLLGSLALLAVRDHFDSSVRGVENLKTLGVQVLAVVPTIETSTELQALRRKDIWFFALSGTYFIGILVTVSREFLR